MLSTYASTRKSSLCRIAKELTEMFNISLEKDDTPETVYLSIKNQRKHHNQIL